MATKSTRTPYWLSRKAKKNTDSVMFYRFPNEITPSQRLVYMVFLANRDSDGIAFVPRAKISIATGLSEATIGLTVVELEKAGLIERAGKVGHTTKHAVRHLPMAPVGEMEPMKTKKAASDEEMMIGGMMLGGTTMTKDCLGSIFGSLEPEDFLNKSCGLIFGLMREIEGSFTAEDIASALLERGRLERVGGVDYLVHLVDCAPLSFRPMEIAKSIFENAVRRRLSSHENKRSVQ